MLTLRPMTARDLPLLRRWLYTPHVAKWYHDPDDWLMEAERQDDEFSWIHHFIAELDGRPVGFCQYYACRDSGEDWLELIDADGAYSIDYLIGEADALRCGLGKQTVIRLEELIAGCEGAKRIAVQPEKENAASRALLRSCGFVLADEGSGIFIKELAV